MSETSPGTTTVEEIADALREDPVLVHPMFGNGRTEQVREALREIVDDVDFPAYVVLAPQPDGLSANDPDRELATLLHERIGGDAVVVVHTDPTGYGSALASFGDVPDEALRHRVSLELAPEGGANAGLGPAGVAARDLRVLDSGGEMDASTYRSFAEQEVWRDPPEWEIDHEVPMPGTYAVFMTMAFVVVAGTVWLLLRNLARWRETAPAGRAPSPRSSGEGPAQVRARVERELDDLADRISRSAAGGSRGAADDPRTRELVDGSYDTARRLLARAGDGDQLDLVGALVLTRVASRALSRRPERTPYRPCFVDPRHGEGRHERAVPVGDRTLDVPVCSTCNKAAAAGVEPMLVPAGLLRRPRPWYELDTVWTRTGYGAFVDDLWLHVATEHAGGQGVAR